MTYYVFSGTLNPTHFTSLWWLNCQDSTINVIVTSAKEVAFTSLFVCLSVSNFCKSFEWIRMKFSGKVGNWPMNRRLNFGSDPEHRLDTGIVLRICHYWETFILICQMAALVRGTLVEVCTVPVLLVVILLGHLQHYLDAACCYRRSKVVCRSVVFL